MRTPHTLSAEDNDEGFVSAHQRTRGNGGTGVVESIHQKDAGAVFLNGVAVYARYGGETGHEALGSLVDDDSAVRFKDCRPEDVRMFRTYVRYLGDEAVIDAEPLKDSRVEMQRVEGVLVDGVRNLAAASWRGESDTSDRTFFPEGDRVALVADPVSLKRYVDANDITGYAAGGGTVVTFRDGDTVDGAPVDLDDPVRSEVDAGGGWVVVDSDADNDDAEDDGDGFLSRIF
ncbi:MAG: hypothetical protein ACLFSW_00380 [Halobacteriales archaeon]